MAVFVRYRKLSALLGFVCLLLLLAVAGASAHAYVVATSPGVNASVTSPPQEVVVVYDEPVGIEGPAALVVRGKDGTTYPCSITHAGSERASRIACTLRTRLPAGTYTVSWRVTSADEHIVQGEFSFGVGVSVYGFVDELQAGALRWWTSVRVTLGGLSDEPIYLLSTPAALALRWLTLLGVAVLVGALGFEWIVLGGRPVEAAAASVIRRWCRRLCVAGAALTLCVSLAALLLPTALITQADSANEAWLVRVGLLCIVLVAMRSRRYALVASIAAALIPACLSVSANAAEGGHQDEGVLSYATDWLHVSAASLYVGGLVVFAAVIRPALAVVRPEARPEFLRDVVAGFSRIAVVSVAAIVASGVYAGVEHVGSFPLLFGTFYGQVILAKVLLLTLLVAFGYFHLRQDRGRSSGRRFVTSVTGEAAIALAVLGLATILIGLAPPA